MQRLFDLTEKMKDVKHCLSPNGPRAFTPLLLILEDVEDAWWFQSPTADQTVMRTDRYMFMLTFIFTTSPCQELGAILATHTKLIHKQCHLAIYQDKQSVKL